MDAPSRRTASTLEFLQGSRLILDCLRRSGGGAVAVPEAEIDAMKTLAARAGAGYVSLESSAALTALPVLLERRLISPDDRIALFDTGAGFKSEAPSVELPPVVPNEPDAWPHMITIR